VEEKNFKNHLILKQGIQILTPQQFERYCDAIPKDRYRVMFQALFFTGMRYSEFIRLWEHPKDFDGRTIHIQRHKKKQKIADRYVHLSIPGMYAVHQFLNGATSPPHPVTMMLNMKRWAKYAGFNPDYFGTRTTRKSWESWLISTMPEKMPLICLSQGHTESVSLKHYANLPFYKEEKEKMNKYTVGWHDD